ncbi:MAG: hypothetical protein ACLGI7_07040 [Gammaproteobacteria bacterium]
MRTATLSKTLSALLLLSASAVAAAEAPAPMPPIDQALGHAIVDQGNRALLAIRAELQTQLRAQTLPPPLPAPLSRVARDGSEAQASAQPL